MQNGSERIGKTKIQIPFGQIEYSGTFKEPIIGVFSSPLPMVQDLVKALKPHGFSIDGVEVHTREKLSDSTVELRRAAPVTSFKITPAKVSINADNLDWSNKDEFIKVMKAGIDAVLEQQQSEFESQLLVLAMHVQIQDRPRKDITAPLLSSTAYQLLSGDSEFQGMVLTRVGVSVVIDASLGHANALFIRLVRQHNANTTLEDMAAQLYADEVHILGVLGLEGEL
jgi:hypothetical protein